MLPIKFAGALIQVMRAIAVQRAIKKAVAKATAASQPVFTIKTKTAFDTQIIRRNWNRINRTPLTRAGMLVRGIARRSIRRAGPKAKPSRPGTPPKSRATDAPLKRIFSVPNRYGTSVMVGPVGFGSFHPATGLHEHGGSASRKVFPNRTQTPFQPAGKAVLATKMVRFPPRPFMQPALMTALPKLPPLWANSLSEN